MYVNSMPKNLIINHLPDIFTFFYDLQKPQSEYYLSTKNGIARFLRKNFELVPQLLFILSYFPYFPKISKKSIVDCQCFQTVVKCLAGHFVFTKPSKIYIYIYIYNELLKIWIKLDRAKICKIAALNPNQYIMIVPPPRPSLQRF